MKNKKSSWRVDAKLTASKPAKEYIRGCGSSCTVYCRTPKGALRIVAKFSGRPQSEFVVIGQ